MDDEQLVPLDMMPKRHDFTYVVFPLKINLFMRTQTQTGMFYKMFF